MSFVKLILQTKVTPLLFVQIREIRVKIKLQYLYTYGDPSTCF